MKITAKQSKDINLILRDTDKILLLLEHHYRQEEQQNNKDYIQDIKSKICDSQAKMKQYNHSHIEQIQKNEEEIFKNDIKIMVVENFRLKEEMKQYANSQT